MSLSDEEFDLAEELEKYRNVVLSACTSLGGLEVIKVPQKTQQDNRSVSKEIYKYVPGDECIECLKDLKRYIRIDEMSGERLVLQWLSEWNILGRDLVPIFKLFAEKWLSWDEKEDKPWYRLSEGREDEYKTVCLCVDMFVFMTWSMDSADPEVRDKFEAALRSYKKSFCDNELISLFVRLITRLFEIPEGWKIDKDRMLLQGSLYVLRNLLSVPDPFISPETVITSDDQLSLQDWMIQIMNDEFGIELFIVTASMAQDKSVKLYSPIVLDLFYSLYLRVSADSLIKNRKDISSLDLLSNRPNEKSTFSSRRGRHSRFGGVFAGMIEPGKLIPIFNAEEAMKIFARNLKKSRNTPRRKVSAEKEYSVLTVLDAEERDASIETLKILKETSISFIKNCFGTLFPQLFDDIEVQRNSLSSVGKLRLLYMTGYFVDFFVEMYKVQRRQTNLASNLSKQHNEDAKVLEFPYVSSVVNQGGIGMCLRQISEGLDLGDWPQVQAAMYCFRSMLKTVKEMSFSENPEYRDSSLYIQSNLFYDGSVMDLVVKIAGSFKPTKQTLKYLIDIVKTVDEFILYENEKTEALSKDIGEDEEALLEENTSSSDDTTSYTDIRFDYNRWIKMFAIKPVVNTYCQAFKACLLLKGQDLKMVSTMIYRIAVICKKPHLFFSKPIFIQLYQFIVNYQTLRKSKIYDSVWVEALTDLQDDVAWIFRQYFILEDEERKFIEEAENKSLSSIIELDEGFDDSLEAFLDSIGNSDTKPSELLDLKKQNKGTVDGTTNKTEQDITSHRSKRYKQDSLFEDKASYIRLRAYLKQTPIGTNEQRYPKKSYINYNSSESESDEMPSDYGTTFGENNTDAGLDSSHSATPDKELENLKNLDRNFLSWKDKIGVLVKIIIGDGKNILVEHALKELEKCIENRNKNTDLESELTGEKSAENDTVNSIMNPDYTFTSLEGSDLFPQGDDIYYSELLTVLRINKIGSGIGSMIIYGFENTNDLESRLTVLKEALETEKVNKILNSLQSNQSQQKNKENQLKQKKGVRKDVKKRKFKGRVFKPTKSSLTNLKISEESNLEIGKTDLSYLRPDNTLSPGLRLHGNAEQSSFINKGVVPDVDLNDSEINKILGLGSEKTTDKKLDSDTSNKKGSDETVNKGSAGLSFKERALILRKRLVKEKNRKTLVKGTRQE
ncbi:hypothetical protein BB560_005097 [Smittium megazygosporum]|uniref:Timeless N-terminal domain-containing protein n=1 Tax=Smittium megazygosporum TaxID=133381 RepID=A0A2T9Z7D9_9FUNG|nr:hypothetical protein BB560_005097 [Smittium megazygosporum]